MQLKKTGPMKQASPTLAKRRPNVNAESPKPCISGSSENLTLRMSPAPQTRHPLALSKVNPNTSLQREQVLGIDTCFGHNASLWW